MAGCTTRSANIFSVTESESILAVVVFKRGSYERYVHLVSLRCAPPNSAKAGVMESTGEDDLRSTLPTKGFSAT